MVPTDDRFRDHVVKLVDGRLMCGFCEQIFAAKTSLWRFKRHWSGVGGHGVRACPRVDPGIKEAASQQAHQQPPNKRRRITMPSSSNVINAASTSAQVQLIEVGELVGDLGSMRLEQGVSGPEGASSDGQAAGDYLDIIFGMGPEEMEKLLNGLPVTEDVTGGIIQPFDTSFSSDRTTAQALEPIGDALQATECQAIQNNAQLILEVTPQNGIGGLVQPGAGTIAQALEPMGDASRGIEFQAIQNNAQLMEVDAENGIGGLVQPVTGIIAQALEPIGDAPRGTECQAIQNNAQLMEVDAENGIGGLVPYVAGGASSSERHPCDTDSETIEDALPTCYTKLVGKAFEKNKNQIWSWLMNDEVSQIGIYGMGGVGKTSLVKRIYRQLLGRSSTFGHVCWITVSQDFSINKMQNGIAKCVDLDLSNEDDEVIKALKLSNQLQKKKSWVIILDDLWSYFELDQVGIPIPMKRCKLIVTTRSLKVCEWMVFHKMMKVEPLSCDEAWILFMEKFGQHKALSPEVEQIAKSITRECDGLPLGIITMAGTMRAVADVREWRNALEELRESKIREDDMEPNVFRILRFSYNHLNDSALQQCFLYCALFPEDEEINREELIAYLIDEGIIEGKKSRHAEFDNGHTMLNKLERVSLLESCQDHRAVKMHDLLRDMAIQIQQKNSQFVVKAGDQLKELPDLEEQKESLVRVSLMKNQIKKILRQSHSVKCPRLSTILLQHNTELRSIADSFFKQMPYLQVLDLSFTNVEFLPDSISGLLFLSALVLRDCPKLRYVPSLKKLKRLRRLDLTATILEKMPQGMKRLSNLRYFSLGGCREKSEFPVGILPKLSRLQLFLQRIPLMNETDLSFSWVIGKEVAHLRKLETLECHFEHLSDMEEYLKSRDGELPRSQKLSSYCLVVGWWFKYEYEVMRSNHHATKTVGLANLSISTRDRNSLVLFPDDMKELWINRCDVPTSLSDVSSSTEYAMELEVIDMRDCTSMESLLSSSWFCSAPLDQQLSSQSIFSGLKRLNCASCKSMKNLFPLILLPNLINLESLSVVCCDKMEEVIARREKDEESSSRSSSDSTTEFSLPKLRTLELRCLYNLESICSEKLRCDSLEEITIFGCPMLKRMPFCLPLPISFRKMEITSREWWEWVRWEDPKAKDVLYSFVTFTWNDIKHRKH